MALRSRAAPRHMLAAGILAVGAVIATRAPELRALPRPASPGQQGSAKPSGPPKNPTYTVKVQRNLVMIRAVVRNRKGELVDGLEQEDFRVLDNGKPQQITEFSVRREATERSATVTKPSPATAPGRPAAQPIQPHATHFIGFYFDDRHLTVQSDMQARLAAQKFLASSWHPGDYAGVFTATGATRLGFTSDLSRVREAIGGINARPSDKDPSYCPYITPYQAYLIVEQHDPIATGMALADAQNCQGQRYGGGTPDGRAAYLNPDDPNSMIVWETAEEMWNYTRYESEVTLSAMVPLIQRMARLPGERTLALVSPGFLTSPSDDRVGRLIDLALRDHVTIGALDARGLYTLGPEKYMRFGRRSSTIGLGSAVAAKMTMAHLEASVADDPLAELAEQTGGTFFHNDNDLVTGFKEVTSEAAVQYLIGFSPSDMEPNGAYHSVKVEIEAPGKYQILARKGYYAPTKAEEAGASVPDPIESALYSSPSSQAFPVAITARVSKAGSSRATVSVTIHVAIPSLGFRAKHGQHEDTLVFRTALFSADGGQVVGDRRTLPLKLNDARFASLSRTGIFAVTQLTVPPGDYTLREVVADGNSGKLSTISQAVGVE